MKKIKGYKAFNKDMTCNGFQYKEGETYEEKEAVLCEKGFHFCTDPFDVLNYYGLYESEFHEVEALAETKSDSNSDSKHVTTKIKIGVKISFCNFIKTTVDSVINICKTKFEKGSKEDHAKIGSSGDSAKIEVGGEYSVAAATGIESRIKAKKGNWITLAEWELDKNKKRYVPLCVKSAQIDGEKLKEDVWYQLKDGKIVDYIS